MLQQIPFSGVLISQPAQWPLRQQTQQTCCALNPTLHLPFLTPAAVQEKLVSGASLSVSHHGYATALAAAAARDARLRQLHSQGQLTDDQLAHRLSLGDEAQPRSRVRGVSYCRTGAPAGRPWRLRLQQRRRTLPHGRMRSWQPWPFFCCRLSSSCRRSGC